VTVTFYFDFASPWAYLGATQIERVAREHGADVRWRPILLGALFRRIGTPDVPIDSFSAPKRAYAFRDLMHWADHWGVAFRWPSRFPVRTVQALRLALATEADCGATKMVELAQALFAALWVHDRDIADGAELRAIAAAHDVPAATVDRSESDAVIKQALFASTDEAIGAGVIGVPSFVVQGHLFWGQDRLDHVARVLSGWTPPT
jgi:2-hydroxychromene-2-carboxylate isomerase